MFSKKHPSPVLNLSKKKLNELPDDIPEATATLVLSDNALVSLPADLRLPKLQVLTLSNNSLSSVPDVVFDMVSLTKLHLDSNKLTSLPGPKFQSGLTRLRKLNVAENCLAVLPHELGSLPELVQVVAQGNPLISPPKFVCSLQETGSTSASGYNNGEWTARYLRELHSAATAQVPEVDGHLFRKAKVGPAGAKADGPEGRNTSVSYFLTDAGVSTTQGHRPYQEDRLVCLPRVRQIPQRGDDGGLPTFEDELNCLVSKVGFFGVYDGHGGAAGSEYLRVHLHRAVCNQNAFGRGDFDLALRNGFRETDHALVRWCAEQRRPDGSTAVVALIVDNQLVTAHAGDSRCVLARKKKAVRITEDHKPFRADEMDRIHAARGKVIFHGGCYRVNGQLAVSRAFGDIVLKSQNLVISEPEINVETLSPDDELIVLATDGLWDVVTDQQAVTAARKASTAAEAAQKLVDVALKRGSSDNISVVVVKFQWARGGFQGAAQGEASSSDSPAPDAPVKVSRVAELAQDGGAPSPQPAGDVRQTFRSVRGGTARRPVKVAFKVLVLPATEPVLQHWPRGTAVSAVTEALVKKYNKDSEGDGDDAGDTEDGSEWLLYDARTREPVDQAVPVETVADGLLILKHSGASFPELRIDDEMLAAKATEISESAGLVVQATLAREKQQQQKLEQHGRPADSGNGPHTDQQLIGYKNLPENWGAATNDDGRTFYFNLLTKETAWQKPVAPGETSDDGWERAVTLDKKVYYYKGLNSKWMI